ncbi:hypothetical protein GJ496_004019 [Pomphorhynchus laevis]|nr:hypothetical protein GJ496_004019 [Pomphorhynchus laevis]
MFEIWSTCCIRCSALKQDCPDQYTTSISEAVDHINDCSEDDVWQRTDTLLRNNIRIDRRIQRAARSAVAEHLSLLLSGVVCGQSSSESRCRLLCFDKNVRRVPSKTRKDCAKTSLANLIK